MNCIQKSHCIVTIHRCDLNHSPDLDDCVRFAKQDIKSGYVIIIC